MYYSSRRTRQTERIMREHDLLAIYSILELCPLLLLSSRSLVLTTAGRESTKARLTSGWRYQRATWSGQAPASYHRPRGKPSKAGPWNGCDEIVECSRDWRCRHPLYTPPGEGLAVVAGWRVVRPGRSPVSYTHLTLPTIYSV